MAEVGVMMRYVPTPLLPTSYNHPTQVSFCGDPEALKSGLQYFGAYLAPPHSSWR